MHCGFCLPACLTYVMWGNEMDSPRGRIYLIKMASDGAVGMTDNWVHHFDTCLGCISCMTACPSGVEYGKLIEATRAQIERGHRRSVAARPSPLDDLQQSLIRRSGLMKLLPKQLRAMVTLMPKLGPAAGIPAVNPARGEKRKRVGLVLGCV